MLSSVSWPLYLAAIVVLLIAYYIMIASIYFRREIYAMFHQRKTTSCIQPAAIFESSPVTAEVIGKVRSTASEQEEFFFAPHDPDEEIATSADRATGDDEPNVGSAYSEMVSEVRTLIHVVAGSTDPLESFELLFPLLIQKFNVLKNTSYQGQINSLLLEESNPDFPVPLDEERLNAYWNEN